MGINIYRPKYDVYSSNKLASNYGLYITKRPEVPSARKRYKEYYVPGRDGALLVDEGYEDIVLPVKFNMVANNAKKAFREAKEFFDYSYTLSFSDDPSVYYNIQSYEIEPAENPMQDVIRFTVNYTLEPFAYLNEEPITLTSPGTIKRKGNYKAEPLIVVYGSGDSTLTISANTMKIFDQKEPIAINSALEEAYTWNGRQNMNKFVFGDYPVFTALSNQVSWTGGISSILIYCNFRYV